MLIYALLHLRPKELLVFQMSFILVAEFCWYLDISFVPCKVEKDQCP